MISCGFIKPDPNIEFTEEGVTVLDGRAPSLYFTDAERRDLMGIAISEAGNQGVKGMALVMRVVLNRLARGGYGNDIHSVIYAPNQFATGAMPSYDFSREAEVAMLWITYGWDESEGALYFCANGYNGPVPLFRYLGHWFSRKDIYERAKE